MQKVIKKQQHPKGLYLLFGVEAWERFSYYGMRALLVLFMTSTVIGFNDSQSAKLYGWFTGLVFLTPLIGGYLADRLIGKRRSIVIGGLLMAIGQFTLAAYDLIPPRISLFAGLTLIAVGNGFFKPNISAMVGDLYEPDDFKRRNEAFSIFYVGINLGAMIAPLICGYLGEAVAWKYGFLSAGCGMLLALLAYFLLQKKYLGKIGLYPAEKENKTTSEHKEKKPLTKAEKDKIKAIFVFSFFAIFFWMVFEQAGSSLTLFASKATILPEINLFGLTTIQMQASFFQSANPIFILTLTPLFLLMWRRLGKMEPSAPNKFGWGLFLQGIGYIIIAVGAGIYLKTGHQVSMIWLVLVYFFCTAGELCLSPVGLSLISKLSPARFISLLMGTWFLSASIGNFLGGQLASFYEEWRLTTLFSVPAGISIVFGIFMWLISRKIKRWMHGVE